ncbi:hypothetical protein [Dolichospermum phage Dfl-JY45]
MLNALKSLLYVTTAAEAVSRMRPVDQPPAPRDAQSDISELVVVGHYADDGDLTLVALAYFSKSRRAFVTAATREAVSAPITHWIPARDQKALSAAPPSG